MKTYDLYLFNSERQVISGWHKFDAAKDEDALKIAEELVKQPPAELWQATALVKRWENDL